MQICRLANPSQSPQQNPTCAENPMAKPSRLGWESTSWTSSACRLVMACVPFCNIISPYVPIYKYYNYKQIVLLMNKMHIEFDIMGLFSPTKNSWLRMLLVSVGWNTNERHAGQDLQVVYLSDDVVAVCKCLILVRTSMTTSKVTPWDSGESGHTSALGDMVIPSWRLGLLPQIDISMHRLRSWPLDLQTFHVIRTKMDATHKPDPNYRYLENDLNLFCNGICKTKKTLQNQHLSTWHAQFRNLSIFV